LKQSVRIAIVYFLSIFFVCAIAVFMNERQRMAGGFWSGILRLSGPALIYLGLVLQRSMKPISLFRKISGIVIFLIGFGWLFSLLMTQHDGY
jgi:hypothetical protein